MEGAQNDERVFSVSELTGIIRRILETHISQVWVEGEVSNFTHYASGHMYFSLKDTSAQIRCVMFSGANRRLGFRPENGMRVRASGTISVYAPQGSYQLVVMEMTPAGIGELHRAFENLKLKLQKEGLFDARWKKPIPVFPSRIGIVTSPDGAAICDIVKVIQKRYPIVDLILCPTRVQGASAAAEIIRSIRTFQSLPTDKKPDVLIVGRGGGSIEDLWPFNEESVARAVFQCDIPVISAVGHEVDFTICDFVADLRAPTPSAAAEAAVPDQQEIRRHLKNMQGRLLREIRSLTRTRRLELDQESHHMFFMPDRMIRDLQLTMDRVTDSLSSAIRNKLYTDSTRLAKIRSMMIQIRPDRQLSNSRADVTARRNGLVAAWREIVLKKRSEVIAMENRITRFDLRSYRQMLELIATRLIGHDPRRILEKGYAICSLPDGSIVSSIADTTTGSNLDVELKDGSLVCRIDGIRRKNHESEE